MNSTIIDSVPDGEELLKTLTVLYVEDDDETRELLTRFLTRRVGTLIVANNGQVGLEQFKQLVPDVVVTDIKMPIMDGLEMAEAIKAAASEVPVIVVTAYSERDYLMRAIEIGVDRYVTKPVDTDLLLKALVQTAQARYQQRQMDISRQTTLEALTQTITVLSRAIEMRDPYTDGHQKRVSLLAVAIATELGLSPARVTGVRLGSLIHDLGKIGVPAEVLSTPRKLTVPERNMIETHPTTGSDILGGAQFPWPVAEMVLNHHERVDGSGYPKGLSDGQICLEARIIAVADVVEAMNSHRPYRPALGIDAAVAEIRKNRGTLYDVDAVDACLRVLERCDFKFWENPAQT